MSRNVSESIALMLAARASRWRSCSTRGSRSRCRSPAGHQPGTPPFDAADGSFHQILADAAGNQLLRSLSAWILEVLQPSLVAHISVHVEAEAILAQHRAILRAVRRHQQKAAERAMQAHIEYLAGVLREIDGA
jgi:DNA-binding FadR family transcriptional regulator